MINKLEDIAQFISGKAFTSKDFTDSPQVDGALPIIRIQNVNSEETKFKYWNKEYEKKYIVNSGDLLMSLSGDFKLKIWEGPKALLNQRVVKIKINNNVNKYYLFKYLQSKIYILTNMGNSSIINNLSIRELKNFSIELPSLTNQNKIESVIRKLDVQLSQRKEQLQLLDELSESLFIDMFGDPVKNTKNFKKQLLKSVTTKIGSGATPRGGNSAYQVSGISLIRSMNVHNNYFNSEGLAYLNDEQAEKLKNVIVKSDDILLNITGASVARTCIINNQFLPARVNQHVSIIRCNNKKINNIFLNRQFTCYYYQLYLMNIATSGGATREAITKKQLENLKIIIPPINLQNEFAQKIEKIEELKKQCQKSLEYYEELYEALLYKTFNGELFNE